MSATVRKAVARFRKDVRLEDQTLFDDTTAQDVRDAAEEVERRLAQKQLSRDLPRLVELLPPLENLAKLLRPLHSDTARLNWLWAPIKLHILVLVDHIEALEAVLDCYEQILSLVPSLNNHDPSCKDDCYVCSSAALVYSDVLLLHGCIYPILRCHGWSTFFQASWTMLSPHFEAIEESLGMYHAHNNFHASSSALAQEVAAAGCADRDANTYASHYTNIHADNTAWQQNGSVHGGVHSYTTNMYASRVPSSPSQRRKQIYDRATTQVAQKNEEILRSVLQWLDAENDTQENEIDHLCGKRYAGTCDWLYTNPKFAPWMTTNTANKKLWIHGKPGSGKSVLAASVVEYLRDKRDSAVAYHLCNFRIPSRNKCTAFLQGMTAQLLRQHRQLAAHVYTEYVLKGKQVSEKNVKQCLIDVLFGLRSSRLILDGLDECASEEQQRMILRHAFEIVDQVQSISNCKVLITSRDISPIEGISRRGRCAIMDLTDELGAINLAVRLYAQGELATFGGLQCDVHAPQSVIREVEDQLVEKAEGMFLWVHLVLFGLDRIYNVYQLREILIGLPPGLEGVYARAFYALSQRLSPIEYAQAMVTLQWVTCGHSPKSGQVADAIAYTSPPHALTADTKLPLSVLRTAKPFIDIGSGADGSLSYVHFTVREYFLKPQGNGTTPIIVRDIALKNMLIACSGALYDSLSLVDPSQTTKRRLDRVAHGLHVLSRYANANWTKHLKQYCESRDDVRARDPHLEASFAALGARHASLLSQLRPGVSIAIDRTTDVYRCVCNKPEFLQLLTWTMEVDKPTMHGKRALHQDGLGQASTEQGATLLEEAINYLAWATERLLLASAQAEFPWLRSEDVERFRAHYAVGTFACRVVGCRSTCFLTAGSRDQHERVHQPRLFCLMINCHTAPGEGFPSSKQLAEHHSRHHKKRVVKLPSYRKSAARIGGTDLVETSPSPPPAPPATSGNAQALSSTKLHKQIHKQIHNKIVRDLKNGIYSSSGLWQQSHPLSDRVARTMQLVSQLRLINTDVSVCLAIAQKWELRIFEEEQSEEQYAEKCESKLNEIRQRRAQRAGNVPPNLASGNGRIDSSQDAPSGDTEGFEQLMDRTYLDSDAMPRSAFRSDLTNDSAYASGVTESSANSVPQMTWPPHLDNSFPPSSYRQQHFRLDKDFNYPQSWNPSGFPIPSGSATGSVTSAGSPYDFPGTSTAKRAFSEIGIDLADNAPPPPVPTVPLPSTPGNAQALSNNNFQQQIHGPQQQQQQQQPQQQQRLQQNTINQTSQQQMANIGPGRQQSGSLIAQRASQMYDEMPEEQRQAARSHLMALGPAYAGYPGLAQQQTQIGNVSDQAFLQSHNLYPANGDNSAFPAFDNTFDTSVLDSFDPSQLDLLGTSNQRLDPMAAMTQSHSPTPAHLFADQQARRPSGSPSPHASPRFQQANYAQQINRPRINSESLDPSSARYAPGGSTEWQHMGAYRSRGFDAGVAATAAAPNEARPSNAVLH